MTDVNELEQAVSLIATGYANGHVNALELAAEMARIGAIARAAGGAGGEFVVAPERVDGELGERLDLAEHELLYHHAFLDDVLRGIASHDLVLVGAETGAGKTDLVTSISRENARRGRHVFYFALEAESREIERRIKFSILAELAEQRGIQGRQRLNFPDWYRGKCEDVIGTLNADADAIIRSQLATLHTYYRGSKFDHDDIRRMFLAVQDRADLIILDHLHYVDNDDDNENRGYKRTLQVIRDLVLGAGVPCILVAHLRKRDLKTRRIVPDIEDFHGSSDIIKICTRAIMLAPARSLPSSNPMTANTFLYVPKDRIGGATGLVALHEFHRSLRAYAQRYRLGHVAAGGEWEELAPSERPRWAGRCR